MSGGVGYRCRSDLALLWLWCILAATAPIQPLAWGLQYAMGMALKRPPPQKKGSKNGHSCLVPGLRAKAFHFLCNLMQPLWMLVIGLSYMAFIVLRDMFTQEKNF